MSTITLDEWLRTLPPSESYQPISGRVHLIADEPDPETGLPTNHPGPKPREPAAPMTYAEAMQVRENAPAPASR